MEEILHRPKGQGVGGGGQIQKINQTFYIRSREQLYGLQLQQITWGGGEGGQSQAAKLTIIQDYWTPGGEGGGAAADTTFQYSHQQVSCFPQSGF